MQTTKSRPGQGTAYARSQPNDTPIDVVLHRLEKVKRTAQDKWQACCPAHDDRNPSLSIREADDHKVLLKCWSGCGAAEIVNALGLSLADLFPGDRHSIDGHRQGPMRKPFDYRDCLTGISNEAIVVSVIASALARGETLDADALDRLGQAEERISDALSAAGGARC